VVVYVIATTPVEREKAIAAIQQLPAGRAVYVVAERPLHLDEPLQQLFALRELQQNPTFLERDRDRLPREISFFVEDAERRLRRALRPCAGVIRRTDSYTSATRFGIISVAYDPYMRLNSSSRRQNGYTVQSSSIPTPTC